MNPQMLENKIKNVLDQYSTTELVNSVVLNMQDDLQRCLTKYINEHVVYETDFPIEFNNDFGRWRIEANGDSFLTPRKAVSKFECKIVILASSDIL